MSSQPVKAIVDDSIDNASILTYTGDWGTDGRRSRNREHNKTVHCTTQQGASATLNFYGSSILLAGTLYNNNAQFDILYSIDQGNETRKTLYEPSKPAEFSVHQTLVEETTLPNGRHSLTTSLATNASGHLCVDYFLFTTTLDDIIQQKEPVTVLVDDQDGNIIFSHAESWKSRGHPETMGGTDRIASKVGSNATFEFYGTYVGVFGSAFSGTPARVSFTLDGGTPTVMPDVNKDGSPPAFGLRFFSQDNIQDGYHKLVITLLNDAEFSLDYITYRPSLSREIYNTTSSSSSPNTLNSHNSIGAIVGGVVGGVVGLAAIVVVTLFYLRLRKKQGDAQPQPSIVVDPYVNQPSYSQQMSLSNPPSTSTQAFSHNPPANPPPYHPAGYPVPRAKGERS